MKLRILLGFFLTLNLTGVLAQNRLKPYEEYIDRYAETAREQQKRHGIPASITLAQGLLESGAGKSELALASNNHFGIKCHNNWKGESVTYFDDGMNSCFRKYDRVSQSFEDHSMFLVNGARYRGLFQLDVTDYTGWARGLQKAGYATDRQYAEKLIKIIETYDLNYYAKNLARKSKKTARTKRARKDRSSGIRVDTASFTSDIIRNAKDYHAMEPVLSASTINPLTTHMVDYVALTPCIKVKYGDSFASIGEEFGLSARRVRKYNDIADDYQLTPGETLFLDKKSTWWEGEHPMHTVAEGETMHQIAQQYALQLNALYKLNDMAPGASLKTGQKIKLRNPEKMSAFMKAMNQSVNMPDTTNNQ